MSAIEKELNAQILYRAPIEGVQIKRMLSVIINPNRYRSKAAEAFCREILPQFTSLDVRFDKKNEESKN